MSILAITSTIAAAQKADTIEEFSILGGTVLALVLCLVLGVFRPRSVVGPLRVEAGRPIWPVLIVGIAGFILWFGSQAGYGLVKQVQLMREQGPKAKLDVENFTTLDWAILATVPGVLGFICLAGGDRIVGQQFVRHLGFSLRSGPKGLAKGVLASLIIYPAILWVEIGINGFYERVGFKHPYEHDLLRQLGQAENPIIKWALLFGATLCAPFFEELLFRGHLQTFIREALVRTSVPRPIAPALPYVTPPPMPIPVAGGWLPVDPAMVPYPGSGSPGNVAPSVVFPAPAPQLGLFDQPGGLVIEPPAMPDFAGSLPYASAPVPVIKAPPDLKPRAWHGWVAIGITSLVFASVHPLWTSPIIFLLSLGLGYTYERTGNLWANTTVHALFNTASTLLYLFSPHP